MDETQQKGSDLGYDEAHDVPPADAHRARPHHPAPAQVPTQSRSGDDSGDYSYDLAHEIPPA